MCSSHSKHLFLLGKVLKVKAQTYTFQFFSDSILSRPASSFCPSTLSNSCTNAWRRLINCFKAHCPPLKRASIIYLTGFRNMVFTWIMLCFLKHLRCCLESVLVICDCWLWIQCCPRLWWSGFSLLPPCSVIFYNFLPNKLFYEFLWRYAKKPVQPPSFWPQGKPSPVECLFMSYSRSP